VNANVIRHSFLSLKDVQYFALERNI